MSSTNQNDTFKTNLAELQFTTSGITLPEESEILDAIIQDFQNAFDSKLQFKKENGEFLLSTPQGQLVTSIAAIISDRNRLLAHYVNQIDPNYAVGRMQDGIGRIYFIERKRATNTTVVGRCYGKINTKILEGTMVKDQQGNVYKSLADATIKDLDEQSNAYVDIVFECLKKGAITCPIKTLTERYQVIQGWESITNLQDGIVGIEDESQAQFEQRRRQSVAHNSLNSVDSIMAALINLDVVDDAYVIENYIDKALEKDKENKFQLPITLKPHSVYVCVSLRTQSTNKNSSSVESIKYQIARSIWSKKPPGCALNGNETVVIKDDTKDINGNLLYCPDTAPEYVINFDVAEPKPICIEVNIAKLKPITGDPVTLVQNKIYSVFMGKDGARKPRIGSQILASQFYCPVQSLGEWIGILSIKVGFLSDQKEFQADPSSSTGLIHPTEDVIRVAINQIPTLDPRHINVTFEEEKKDVFNE
ncbi:MULTISPECIES: baseplate J/gp47 family protein [Commensalibacter]|uniref:Uncharacterized phage protein gp47/JayE (JayE) n=2 Tax=Commensalibacter TaxID=1079922 RepID=A0ABM9HLD6_9PROT|nr:MULTISPECIES: baseplate J/gp47 family protein [Commensalibacter]EUK19241.1 putative bacteriophage protein [Commensalibacter papalotli (ex Servin-Garciduenas et al. 2014)]CAI3931837.1 Uncharacterized phage protein gp47/JayE (JayE) [Commensalibacter papalotli (ex Botero et al. 2024)]CAI3946871.1 Uncharacterized phage protein gp47/JayE (JayE) [Commensalibacter papalotli (ex Botero et al. 2024)]